jgi:hypothetical protein
MFLLGNIIPIADFSLDLGLDGSRSSLPENGLKLMVSDTSHDDYG